MTSIGSSDSVFVSSSRGSQESIGSPRSSASSSPKESLLSDKDASFQVMLTLTVRRLHCVVSCGISAVDKDGN